MHETATDAGRVRRYNARDVAGAAEWRRSLDEARAFGLDDSIGRIGALADGPRITADDGVALPVRANLVFEYWAIPTMLVLDGSNGVSQWLDSSGNGNHSQVQGTIGARPLYVASGALAGGKPALRWASPKYLLTPATLSLPNPGTTVFSVGGAASQSGLLLQDGQISNQRYVIWGSSATDMQMLWGGGTITGTRTLTAAGALFTQIYNGASSKLRYNGTLIGTSGAASSITSIGMVLGARFSLASNFWVGDIGLFAAYSAVLSDADIDLNEAYIRSYLPGLW